MAPHGVTTVKDIPPHDSLQGLCWTSSLALTRIAPPASRAARFTEVLGDGNASALRALGVVERRASLSASRVRRRSYSVAIAPHASLPAAVSVRWPSLSKRARQPKIASTLFTETPVSSAIPLRSAPPAPPARPAAATTSRFPLASRTSAR